LGDLWTIDQFLGPDVLVSNRSCIWNAASVWITDLVWYKRKLQSVVPWPWGRENDRFKFAQNQTTASTAFWILKG
jgi:hypothetical protein